MNLKGTSELILGWVVLEKSLNEQHKNKKKPCTTIQILHTRRENIICLELLNTATEPGPPTLQPNMWMNSHNTAHLHLIIETHIETEHHIF